MQQAPHPRQYFLFERVANQRKAAVIAIAGRAQGQRLIHDQRGNRRQAGVELAVLKTEALVRLLGDRGDHADQPLAHHHRRGDDRSHVAERLCPRGVLVSGRANLHFAGLGGQSHQALADRDTRSDEFRFRLGVAIGHDEHQFIAFRVEDRQRAFIAADGADAGFDRKPQHLILAGARLCAKIALHQVGLNLLRFGHVLPLRSGRRTTCRHACGRLACRRGGGRTHRDGSRHLEISAAGIGLPRVQQRLEQVRPP